MSTNTRPCWISCDVSGGFTARSSLAQPRLLPLSLPLELSNIKGLHEAQCLLSKMPHRGVHARQTINYSLQLSLSVFCSLCLEHVDIATGVPAWVLDVEVIEPLSPAVCSARSAAQQTGANLDWERALRWAEEYGTAVGQDRERARRARQRRLRERKDLKWSMFKSWRRGWVVLQPIDFFSYWTLLLFSTHKQHKHSSYTVIWLSLFFWVPNVPFCTYRVRLFTEVTITAQNKYDYLFYAIICNVGFY